MTERGRNLVDDDAGSETGSPPTASVPLPRRSPRPGRSEIARARAELFDDADAGGLRADTPDTEPAPDTEPHPAPEPVTEADTPAPPSDALTPAQDPPTVFLTTPGPRSQGPAPQGPAPQGPAPQGPGGTPPPPPRSDAPATGERRSWSRIVPALIVVAVLLGLAFGIGHATGSAASRDAAAPALPSRPTMIGQVLSVRSADTVTVRVADQTFDVSVLGLDAPQPARPASPAGPAVPAECGADAGIAYASDMLVGRQVTLVPDPTVDEFDQQGRRFAYLVLRTEQNYTDQALVAGVARVSTERALWYSDVLAQGETTARAAEAGIWGFPCQETR